MIEGKEMVKKLGKEKFANLVTHSQPKETGAYLERKRRWSGGRTCMAYCRHGVMTVKDYKETNLCKTCDVVSSKAHAIRVDKGEYFNIGLGTYGTESEHRKFAKQKGLICTG